MKIGAVIVAAGMSRRMKQFKQLMKVGEFSFAERVIQNFRRAGVRDIVMVTGFRAESVERALEHLGVTFLRNENYERTEMFESAKIGLSWFEGKADKVFFSPVDVPFFLEETLKLEMMREESIVFTICCNRIGHPILFDAGLIPDILCYTGQGGLKGALDSLNDQKVCYLPVTDEGAVMDADTPQDLTYLVDLQNAELLRPETEVTLAIHNTPCFGPETVHLLKQINALGSVAEACVSAGVSYSKGWKMIRAAEEGIGYRIVDRRPGGKHGGTSFLTERGQKFIELYIILEKRVKDAAVREFCDIFSASDLFPKSSREGGTTRDADPADPSRETGK